MAANREHYESSVDESTSDELDERPEPLGTRIIRRLKQPQTTSDLLLAVKAVIAATAAWAIAVGVFDSEVAFMAPWTALLTVHRSEERRVGKESRSSGSRGQ